MYACCFPKKRQQAPVRIYKFSFFHKKIAANIYHFSQVRVVDLPGVFIFICCLFLFLEPGTGKGSSYIQS
jgi:hypothetical protein